MTCRYDRGSLKRDTKKQLLVNELFIKAPFLPKHEAATGKSVQRNKEDEERKKARKCWRTSKSFNHRVACFGWFVRIADRVRLHHSGQELIDEISAKTLAVRVKHRYN